MLCDLPSESSALCELVLPYASVVSRPVREETVFPDQVGTKRTMRVGRMRKLHALPGPPGRKRRRRLKEELLFLDKSDVWPLVESGDWASLWRKYLDDGFVVARCAVPREVCGRAVSSSAQSRDAMCGHSERADSVAKHGKLNKVLRALGQGRSFVENRLFDTVVRDARMKADAPGELIPCQRRQPATTQNDIVVGNVWIALEQMDFRDIGGLVVEKRRQPAADFDDDESSWHFFHFEAGDAIIFDKDLRYATPRNRTDHSRFSVEARFAIVPLSTTLR